METKNEQNEQNPFFCPFCRLTTSNKKSMENHLLDCINVRKPIWSPKKKQQYFCEICDYKCSKKSNFIRHFFTAKNTWKHFGNNYKTYNTVCCDVDNRN